jgi:D-3-phosphoglycerate dehydrogenase / 2-oxoglutarate reductase
VQGPAPDGNPGAGEPVVALSVSSFAQADASPLEELRASNVRVLENPHGRKLSEDEVTELLREADGVIAGTEPLTAAVFDAAPRLRVISRVGVGLDNVDLAAASERGIAVLNTPDAVTDAAAELTVAGILSALRHVHTMDAELRAGRWTRQMGSLLRGKTVGIVGLGRIGRRVAELVSPFRVEVVGNDVAPDADWCASHGVELLELPELLSRSDVLTLHVAGKQERPIVGAGEIERMKPGAVLVNAARGGLVDEDALATALQGGHLGGAFVDVFGKEPYDGPLRDLPTAVLTPHAGSYAREARLMMESEAVRNVLAGLREAAPR